MAFELYNPEGPRRSREPTVTIYSGEQCFSLNRPAFSALGEPQQIHLYYDRNTRLVGMGPAAKRSPAALNLKTGPEGRYYRVGVTGFMRRYDIPLAPSRRYYATARATDDGPMLVVDLKEEPIWVAAE
jgi:hypothetical protein